jgi:hypothetical protein
MRSKGIIQGKSAWKNPPAGAVTAALAVLLVYAATISPARAACTPTCAVTETTKINWGTLQKPSSGSVTYVVHSDGSADSGTATLLYGTPTRGQYTLTRTGGTSGCSSTTVDVQNVSTGDAGVTLGSWKGTILAAENSLPYTLNGQYPSTSGTTAYLGATATITSSATNHQLSPSFDIVCTIQ